MLQSSLDRRVIMSVYTVCIVYTVYTLYNSPIAKPLIMKISIYRLKTNRDSVKERISYLQAVNVRVKFSDPRTKVTLKHSLFCFFLC